MTIAKELGCSRVVLPKIASALSASGMQFAHIVAEETASLFMLSSAFNIDAVNATLGSLQHRLEAFRAELPMQDARYEVEFIVEARYQMQVWELDTPLKKSRFENQQDVQEFVDSFHRVHERVFAVRDEGSAVEMVNWKARLTVMLDTVDISKGKIAKVSEAKPHSIRNCFFGGNKPMPTQIFRETNIVAGLTIEGPAIIEEPTTTLVVNPGMSVSVSAHGNYLLHI